MKNVQKEAARDAAEFVAAKMAYGEGAGIRRRHVMSAIGYKAEMIPGYEKAYIDAVGKVDMAKAVKSAKRVGKTRDISGFASRNIRAAARGERHNMSTSIIVGVTVLAVAHQTGYDKKVVAYTKRKTGDVRAWLKRKL